MRKVKKILDIHEQDPPLFPGTSAGIEICNIKHSPVHFHSSCIEMILCVSGSVDLRCNHETVTLNAGEIFTIGYGDTHCIYSNNDNIVISFYIDMKALNISWETMKYIYFSCEDKSCELYQKKPLQEIKSCILAASYKYIKETRPDSATMKTACLKIFDLLMEHFDFFNKINLSPNKDNELRQRFRVIMAYCSENYNQKLTIPQVAEVVHISTNYFSQFIHKSGYKTFNGLMGYIRCFEAQNKLLTTEQTVIQISDECGFPNVNSFYKSFHAIWNTTPKEFRQWYADYIKTENQIYYYTSEEIFSLLAAIVAEHFVETTLS